MFDRLKKAFSGGGGKPAQEADAGASPGSRDPVSEWAASQGLAFVQSSSGQGFALKGQVGGKPWRLELGRPSRDYVRGEELRARAELAIDEDVSVLLMNRPLKERLEKQTYATFTDSLQTMADATLPEEMRWLSLYEEMAWADLPNEFWSRYAVLADRRENATAWIDAPLARLLLAWPEPAPGPEVPFMLMLMRGKAYLRMQYEPADMATVQYAARAFTSACDAALGGLAASVSRRG